MIAAQEGVGTARLLVTLGEPADGGAGRMVLSHDAMCCYHEAPEALLPAVLRDGTICTFTTLSCPRCAGRA